VPIISELCGATYEEKLEELDMTMLEGRRHRADLLQVFKILARKGNMDRDS
jgi:hypothetical protein